MSLNIDLLTSSFQLVVEREPNLTHRFYDLLFARYPQAQELFGRHARQQQEQMLTDALVAVVDHLEDAPWLESTLTGLGQKHEEYGVTPEMFPWVGECLLATLADVAGEAWSQAHNAAWSEAYAAITAGMLKGYRQPQ